MYLFLDFCFCECGLEILCSFMWVFYIMFFVTFYITFWSYFLVTFSRISSILVLSVGWRLFDSSYFISYFLSCFHVIVYWWSLCSFMWVIAFCVICFVTFCITFVSHFRVTFSCIPTFYFLNVDWRSLIHNIILVNYIHYSSKTH